MGGLELLLPLLILLPLLLITFRGRKQQKTFAETQARIAPGIDVMTTAGLYGRVLEVDDDVVVLGVADGVSLRWAKGAIVKIVSDADAAAPPPASDQGVGLTKPERKDG